MKRLRVYAINFIKIFFLKIRNSNKLNISLFQSFEHLRIDIKGESKLIVGRFNQNRGNLYLNVTNGTMKIGSNCFFNINSSITCLNKINIGDKCKFGNNLVIVDHDHNFKTEEPEFITQAISIGNNVWVGANVTILKGAIIGNNCVIGAGSVVRGNIPDNTIYLSGTDIKIKTIENK